MRANSAMGVSEEVFVSSKSWRIFSPVGVPPGSRVTTTDRPCAVNTAANLASCVLLPQPSSPSKVMNRPRAAWEGTESIIAKPLGAVAQVPLQQISRKTRTARKEIARNTVRVTTLTFDCYSHWFFAVSLTSSLIQELH